MPHLQSYVRNDTSWDDVFMWCFLGLAFVGALVVIHFPGARDVPPGPVSVDAYNAELGGVETSDVTGGKPDRPLEVVLDARSLPGAPGESGFVRATVYASIYLPHVTLEIVLPPDWDLVEGVWRWEGEIRAGRSQMIETPVRAAGEHPYVVEARAQAVFPTGTTFGASDRVEIGSEGKPHAEEGVDKVDPTGRPVREFKAKDP